MLKYKDHCIFKQGIEKNCVFSILKHTWHILKQMLHYKKQPLKVTSILKKIFSTYFSNVKFEN
jgi:hypothetical protein